MMVAVATIIVPSTLDVATLDGEPPAGGCDGTTPCAPSSMLARLEMALGQHMPDISEVDRIRLADVIHEEARLASLDPFFVLAVISVESGFNLDAESARGARGLMQLRPATYRRELERWKISHEGEDDPILNVRAGIRYYRRLIRIFGSFDLALMAYNAGPNRILGFVQNKVAIPERFHEYPRKVKNEWKRFKQQPTELAMVEAPDPAVGAAGSGGKDSKAVVR